MKCVQVVFALCVLIRGAHGAATSVEWCYDDPKCGQAMWPTIAAEYCNGTRQSPIDIVTKDAKGDAKLTAFTFKGFDNKAGLTKIENTGKTVKVTLAEGIGFSGGDLESYVSLQFHLHWGNGTAVPGSEHTIDGKRYPMALHIVNIKESHGLNVTQGFADPMGFAALGFLIDVTSGSETNSPASWSKLTSYLANITEKGQSATMASGMSLDDLIAGVNTTKYYRYLGSLTTPLCQESVVWTVFKDPIKISKDLIDLFSTTVLVGNATSNYMVNVYRDVQPAQPVTTQMAETGTSMASRTSSSIALGLLMLGLTLVMH